MARGFLAAFDLAAHRAVADLHGHVVDGGVLRQREGVDGFDLFLVGVLEFLRDGDAGEEAADLRLDVGMLQRTGSGGLAFAG